MTALNEHVSTAKDTLPSQRIAVTPETFFSMRQAADAVISPDGCYAAFVISEWLPDQQKQRRRIWLAATSGDEPLPLTRGVSADTSPAWSPDSRSLAFVSKGEDRGAKPQLYVQAVDDTRPRQVCTMPNGVSDVAWSPDGSRIAFISLEGPEPAEDPLILNSTSGRHKRLWVVRADHDTPEPVTTEGISIWNYAWSPDSRQFAVYFATGPEETDWHRGQIGLVLAGGGAVRQVSQLTRQAFNLKWSPDGTQIAYVSGEWSDPDRSGGDVFVQSVSDQHVRNLTPGLDWSVSWCQWLPGGQHLLCAGWHGVTCRVALLDVASGQVSILDDELLLGDRHWPHLSITPDGRHAVATRAAGLYPYDAWSAEFVYGDNNLPIDVKWQRLSRLNALAEETLVLTESQRIRYKSVDDWTIDALLTLPPQQTTGELPPLIVYVHGGPSGAWLDDWENYRTQMFVAAGFAVLRPNVRGSMGGGVAFADAVLGDMGGKDFQDILHGVDYLIERKLVDSERIGITGWSYGGFMTAWAVTQTNRFKAACMGAGICDFHSFHAQSNVPDWDMRFLGQPPVNPSTHPDVYRERSAITYADRITTPTLIVHGEKDACVPVSQAYAFYRALLEKKVPVELAIYPREGHGPTERQHLLDYHQRMLAWFKRYL